MRRTPFPCPDLQTIHVVPDPGVTRRSRARLSAAASARGSRRQTCSARTARSTVGRVKKGFRESVDGAPRPTRAKSSATSAPSTLSRKHTPRSDLPGCQKSVRGRAPGSLLPVGTTPTTPCFRAAALRRTKTLGVVGRRRAERRRTGRGHPGLRTSALVWRPGRGHPRFRTSALVRRPSSG
jgi:hypothetical protein